MFPKDLFTPLFQDKLHPLWIRNTPMGILCHSLDMFYTIVHPPSSPFHSIILPSVLLSVLPPYTNIRPIPLFPELNTPDFRWLSRWKLLLLPPVHPLSLEHLRSEWIYFAIACSCFGPASAPVLKSFTVQ
ncbi:hypothetical protein BDR06DRAFT_1004621 [Suillus hirtellus]|nr:hypothetical protein BDR06DRAFT_1004621 [Suillus hirtellus]